MFRVSNIYVSIFIYLIFRFAFSKILDVDQNLMVWVMTFQRWGKGGTLYLNISIPCPSVNSSSPPCLSTIRHPHPLWDPSTFDDHWWDQQTLTASGNHLRHDKHILFISLSFMSWLWPPSLFVHTHLQPVFTPLTLLPSSTSQQPQHHPLTPDHPSFLMSNTNIDPSSKS